MIEISWSIAQNGSSGNANCCSWKAAHLSFAWMYRWAPSCLFMMSLLFHISLSCFLVHSSVAVGRREGTLLFCIAGIDAIWSQMAAKMSNWECLHIINCSCFLAARGDGRVPSSSPEQRDKEGDTLIACDYNPLVWGILNPTLGLGFHWTVG